MRQYYEANKERIQQYREANKEKRLKQMSEYYNSPQGRAKIMVGHFKQSDKKYNRGECTITEEWILENIFTSKCHYCGITGWENLGCDRINNDLPHTPENVVCSCFTCNRKRQNMPFDEFVAKCKEAGEIVTNRNRKDQSRRVIALDEDRNIVMEFPSTKEAGRNGYNQSAVCRCCNGCYLREGNHQYKGLLWFWE